MARLLLHNTAHRQRRFLPLDFDIAEVLGRCTGGLLGHRQITDAWLLTLAIRSDVRLITFDAASANCSRRLAERQRHLRVLA